MFIVEKCHHNISIQDLGRPTAQHLGFSGSGAADEYSFLLANQLLNNPSNTPALEITLGQTTLKFTKPSSFVITGANCRATLDNKSITNNNVYQAPQGSQLVLTMPRQMIFSYLAVKGGFACQYWQHSASQAKAEDALGLTSPTIESGTLFNAANIRPTTGTSLYQPQSTSHFHDNKRLTLRFIADQNWSTLTKQQQQEIIDSHFVISPTSNRMGYRLTGEPVKVKLAQTLSMPVSYGTIQLPDDGQPIILMKDRQTIGGYPVLGRVSRLDLFRLSQKRPGESVKLLPMSYQQAQAQLFAFYSQFQQRVFEHLECSEHTSQNS